VKKHKAVFLDRDGVINKKPPPHSYILSWKEFKLLPYVKEALVDLNQRGFLIVIVSNQRGIARRMLRRKDLEEIHARMTGELKKVGAVVNGVYYCPHNYSDNCNCRKPKPGMLLSAASDLNIDTSQSFMVGDSEDDIAAGKESGCKTVLVLTGETEDVPQTKDWGYRPDFVIADLKGLQDVIS